MKILHIKLPSLNTPYIEILAEGGSFDLHAYPEFRGFQYGTDGTFKLKWQIEEQYHDIYKVAGETITSITRIFNNVSSLSVTPRDPEMPQNEDLTLEDYTLLSSDQNSIRFLFRFHGGMTIDVSAQKFSIECK